MAAQPFQNVLVFPLSVASIPPSMRVRAARCDALRESALPLFWRVPLTQDTARNDSRMNTPTPWPFSARWLKHCLLFLLLTLPSVRLAGQEVSPTLMTNPPAFGTFYWLSGLPPAPYPFDPAHGLLPIWSFNGAFYVDDSEILQDLGVGGDMMLMSDPAPSPGEGGGVGGGATNAPCNSLTNFTVEYFYSTNSLMLGITPTTNPWIALTIQTVTTNLSYDLFGTTNMVELALPSLSRTNWTWLERAYARATNFSWGQTNWCERYFQLGTMADGDNDGLTDAYETLVLKTQTNVANSPRGIYEGVISNQIPSAWFKLNNESGNGLVDTQGGLSLTNGGGAWDPDAFAIGNGAFSFTVDSARLTVSDLINGGSGTNQGSVCLLFRSLTGLATTRRFLMWQEDSINSNRFGVFFEDDNSGPYPGNLCVQVGGQTNVILASNAIAFEAWYYLAITWDETRADGDGAEVTWYLGRVGAALTNGTLNLSDGAVVGNSSTLYLGNRHTADRAFRSPGNGALDEIAFWNRELAPTEVKAQFDTLKPLFQGPAKVFDLSRWNILLPVDKTNQLGPTNAALEISARWLSSGFKYVDPADWTQKYFYLSTNNTIVFEAPWNGARSSGGSGARSELRETKADGSKNNWAPLGTNSLEATCTVHSAGTNNDRKVIIGQAHSETASDPPVVISYNFPSAKNVTATYKTSPTGGTDLNLLLATNVNLLDQIRYQLRLTGDGTNLSLHVEASVNGVFQTATNQQDRPLATSSSDAWHANTFYFKAGCYFPTNGSGSPIAGNAKVTFSSLTATH
jgi:hypothetical protein